MICPKLSTVHHWLNLFLALHCNRFSHADVKVTAISSAVCELMSPLKQAIIYNIPLFILSDRGQVFVVTVPAFQIIKVKSTPNIMECKHLGLAYLFNGSSV